jgi:RNA polymerase sigma factor (sigma-70 family)
MTVAYDDARWALMAQHRERLVRIARRRLSPGTDPEDCVHDAMLRCDGAAEVDNERIGALLTTIVIRLCIDRERRARIAARATARYAAMRAIEHDAVETIVDVAEARWLASLVGELGPTERAVLLTRAEGHSVGETALRLGISYKAVEGAFTRARQKLRRSLGNRGETTYAGHEGRRRVARNPGCTTHAVADGDLGNTVVAEDGPHRPRPPRPTGRR